MRQLILLISLIVLTQCTISSQVDELTYSVPETPWPDFYGHHRAVIQVDAPADVVKLDLLWRRHDTAPEKKLFVIVNAETGDTIKNIHRIEVNNEHCKLAFGPVQTGTYYFYYAPFKIQEEYGFYNKGYLRPEKASSDWVQNYKLTDESVLQQLPHAKAKAIQSRTQFDSFYPMELIPTQEEKSKFLAEKSGDFLIFSEDRKDPIRMRDEIPVKWIIEDKGKDFEGKAMRNEYYAFQLGVYASAKDVQNIQVQFSDLKNGKYSLSKEQLTCFNTGGIDPFGKPFTKKVDVEAGKVQPLWIGVDIPESAKAGVYKGEVIITADNSAPQVAKVKLKVEDKVIADRGDSEPWRHSRLRWLNSTLGIDDEPTAGYDPIKAINDYTYDCTGKVVRLNANGMPESMKAFGTEILAGPIAFTIKTKGQEAGLSGMSDIELLNNSAGVMTGRWEDRVGTINVLAEGSLESDGYMHYKINLSASEDIKVDDIRLEIPLEKSVARYMMGMGLEGCKVPQNHNAKWKGPHDSFWVGDTNGGIWCELRGSDYNGPLLNLYQPDYPVSWHNDGKGGFKIDTQSTQVKAICYSGKRTLKKGEQIDFEWAMLITPVKHINYESQFVDRYYHNGGAPMPTQEDFDAGVKIINVHHANEYNPHINYPFIAVDEMKGFINDMHEKGQKVKIYNTVRELTNYTTELWALRSLGNEILGDGKGGGYPWLREHLIDGYHPQWYQYFPEKSADASIVNTPSDSRWYNYYIEGLAWLVRNIDIDGLYLDDVSYDRRIVKRMRKVLDKEKPGCILDLHSNTGFSKGPATQYTEYFPYLDKLWFGESFHYDKMSPENWLVEVSGIPFGLMGDMLHRGGNRWLGMLYGMTVRHPWVTDGVLCDPRPIWKVWDDFGIHTAQMVGFWESKPYVTTTNPNVKATVYKKDGKTLVALGNFSEKTEQCQLIIDWNSLGLSKEKVSLQAPLVKDFQAAKSFSANETISVEAKKGWMIIIAE
ncbi:hypothetical protein KEM09_14820 [Carboxylicivirga mesophila]|uniref:Glycoside hydrolase 123-like N-terminal domain-containing protein n=1 Tax=Carboxylicivirga mesophila TaxID=1166478 RepID=A0ABS5KCN7_9BACT|nr:glycoside hydrolase domain-containing protein [Carboxylicivirga mesophila]MBS2212689.1 hypothetical protein [Carboxylicivirga mesophila]